MKNKNLSAVLVILFLSCILATCGDNGAKGDGIPKPWSWTQGAFSLTVDGEGAAPQTGDTFSMSLLGYDTISGTIEVNNSRSARGAINDPRWGDWIFKVNVPPDKDDFDGGESDGTLVIDPPDDDDILWAVPPDGKITTPTLPASIGSDQLGGKTYSFGTYVDWTFNSANKTYRRHHNMGTMGYEDGLDYEEGRYAWDSARKIIILLPDKAAPSVESGPLQTKDEYMVGMEDMKNDLLGEGFTDADVASSFGGKYKTFDEFIIAIVNQRFGLRVFSYEVNGATITKFSRKVATTLVDTGTEIGGNAYSASTTDSFGTIQYRLADNSYEEAKAKLITFLGAANDWDVSQEASSSLATSTVIFEDRVAFDDYRLTQYKTGGWSEHITWTRLNLREF